MVRPESELRADAVGVQDMASSSEGTRRVTTSDLLAASNDPSVTPRTLEFWRHQGLLPKATRTGQRGKRPEWTYPAEAVDQLRALLALRKKSRDPDLLRVALWFDGFPIDVGRVRGSIVAALRHFLDLLHKEIQRHREPTAGDDDGTWKALERVGHVAAGKRGTNSIPHYGRQKREERARAMTLALGLVLGDEGSVSRLEQDAHLLERMVGVDRGRRRRGDVPPWLEGPPSEGLEAFAYFGSLPALMTTMASATDEELKASRTLARIMLDGITAFTRIADSLTGTDNAVGLGAIRAFRDEPAAAVWLTAFVIAAGRSSMLSENLRSVVDALSEKVLPVDERARELAALTENELSERLPELERLPFVEQVRVKRLIAEYRGQ